MTRLWSLSLAALVTASLALLPVRGQEEKGATKGAEKKERPKDAEEEKPVVTHHEVRVGDRALKYTATVGLMPIADREGKVEAHMSYVAYTADDPGDRSRRPLMFSFNGGPGSSSVWLHLGALGPRRVEMPDDPTIPPPPFRLIENGESWLDRTD